jgi:selenocysteine-specific elongation factor
MLKEKEREVAGRIREYHVMHPLRHGIPKAELLSEFSLTISSGLLEFLLEKLEASECVRRKDNLLYVDGFLPSYPKQWQKRMEQVVQELARDKITPLPFSQYCKNAGLPEKEAHDFKYFLLNQKKTYQLDDSHLIDGQEFLVAVDYLKSQTDEAIELSEIKEMLQLSRKYLIPFVELMDALGITEREGTKRRWI